mgnify:CR=1 FL=1
MPESRTLYLISGAKDGEGFWKIGSTKHLDPLEEDKKYFLECFRREPVGESTAKELENAILLNIENLIADCISDGFDIHQSTEGISYDLPLNVLEDIFDFWFELYQQPEIWLKCLGLLKCRGKISFSDPAMLRGLKGFTAEWGSKIEALHRYRPPAPRKVRETQEPMWG